MSRRADRVAEEIRHTVTGIIADKLKDPRIGFITITRVNITDDLRNATIFYTALGDESTKKVADDGFQSALKFIRSEIGHALKLRFTPDIIIKRDEQLEYEQQVEEALRKIREQEKQ